MEVEENRLDNVLVIRNNINDIRIEISWKPQGPIPQKKKTKKIISTLHFPNFGEEVSPISKSHFIKFLVFNEKALSITKEIELRD